MTLIAEDVLVSRDTIELAVEKMALACCRGPVQHAVILKLIEDGKLEVTYEHAEFFANGHRRVIGGYYLDKSSWINLRKRLRACGFSIKRAWPTDGTAFYTAYWRAS